MRRLLLLVIMLLAAALCSATVTLPVEVLGPDGTTNSATFTYPSTLPPSAAVTLSMQVHNLSYDGKMDLQINSGSWVSIGNSTPGVSVPGIAGQVGGIGGGFDTIVVRYALPPGAITAGSNTITWRMNHTDGVSIGFRILAFNLLTIAGVNILPDNTFAQADVNAPAFRYNNGVSAAQFQIDKGKDAFQHYVLKLNSANLAPNIRAHCSDCHDENGADLRYFNFSNNSIIQRSIFHAVPRATAVQIACYIRSLTSPNPGRPWSPLYQPGPGLDSAPVSAWSAGAGLGAVLASDNAMQPYLFTGDHTISAANMATSGHINPRETPTWLQFPSWISWLPRIHPLDSFGTTFTNAAFSQFYSTAESHIVTLGAATYTANVNGGSYQNRSWAGRDQTKADGDWVTFKNARQAEFGPVASWTASQMEELYSAKQWQAVKQWSLEQRYALEEYGLATYGSARGEKRMWYGQLHFYVAPGIIGIPNNNTQAPRGQAGNGSKWWITANTFWYDLQIVLNDGGGFRVTTSPVDYPYYQNSVGTMERICGTQSAYQVMFYTILKFQLNHNSYGLDASRGWDARLQESLEPYYDPGSADIWFAKLDAPTRSKLFSAFTRTWLTENQLYSPSQFYASGETSAGEDWLAYPNLAQETYEILHRAAVFGVDAGVVADVRTWAYTMWPSRDWASVH